MDFKGSVGYLIHELAQIVTNESDHVLQTRFGIGFSQYKVLLVLGEKQGIPQKFIAQSLSQTEASISRQIGLLIDKDLVEIGPSDDNRQHPIYLTMKGQELVSKADNAINNHLAPFFSDIDENQLSKLLETLYDIRRKWVR